MIYVPLLLQAFGRLTPELTGREVSASCDKFSIRGKLIPLAFNELLDAGLFVTLNLEIWILDDPKDIAIRVSHRSHANATTHLLHLAMLLCAKLKHSFV